MRRVLSSFSGVTANALVSSTSTRSAHVLPRVALPASAVTMCEDMATKLPEDGTVVSAVEFRSLVDEAFPDRDYNAFGVYTARQLAENLPSVFKVVPDEETGWYCVGRKVNEEADGTESQKPKFVLDAKTIAPGVAVRVKDILPQEARGMSAKDILSSLKQQPDVELVTRVRITPRPNARGAHVFIDGDHLPREMVKSLAGVLKLQSVNSTKVVVRQPSSSPHGPTDIVCPSQTQTYQVLETHVDHLLVGAPAVLKDVIILCGETSKDVYTQVAKRYAAKMRIFVCTPSTMAKVE